MTIISLDPASKTGWAVFDISNGKQYKILDSGCIDTGRTRANKFTYLETELRKILAAHSPSHAFLEQLYSYPILRHVVKMMPNGRPTVKRISCNKQLQKYGAYWELVNKTVSDWGVPCHYIDTRRLAKKRVAIMNAKNFVSKKRMTSHEAECICFGQWVMKNWEKATSEKI